MTITTLLIKKQLAAKKKRKAITAHLWNGSPESKLTVRLKNTGGRNQHGRVTCRTKSSMGMRRKYRLVDFKRTTDGISATVQRIEYDPIRSAWIALIEYENDEKTKSYILCPEGILAGAKVISNPETKPLVGNCCELKNIPVGTPVHNIELVPGKGGKIVRSAGSFAKVQGKEANFVILKLPSGEVRKVDMNCRATIGVVSNSDHRNRIIGSAGLNRYMGRKPQSRGVAKNPVDHHNGGRTSGGKVLCSRKGTMKKGQRTRNKKKASSSLILQRRK